MSEAMTSPDIRWMKPGEEQGPFAFGDGPELGDLPANGRPRRFGFRVGAIRLLIPTGTRSEVLAQPTIYPLPKTAAWLLGLVNVRGSLVPVFDLHLVLGQVADTERQKRTLLVLDEGASAVGALIDGFPKFTDVEQKPARAPSVPPPLSDHLLEAYVRDREYWLDFRHKEFFSCLRDKASG